MTSRRALRLLAGGQPADWHGCRLVATEVHAGTPVTLAAAGCTRPGAGCALSTSAPCVAAGAGLLPLPCRRGGLARRLARRLQRLLDDPLTPPVVAGRALAQLARSPEPWARTDAAGDPACPAPLVAGLASDWWWEVRAAVAARKELPAALALHLAGDPSEWVRRALADNPGADPAVLAALHTDPHLGVRDAVAEHPATPDATLLAMVCDPAWEVRRSLAKRPRVPAEVLVALGHDPEHWVRFFVACNPATPEPVRTELAGDRRPSVRVLASRAGRRARDTALALGRGIDPTRAGHARPPGEAGPPPVD